LWYGDKPTSANRCTPSIAPQEVRAHGIPAGLQDDRRRETIGLLREFGNLEFDAEQRPENLTYFHHLSEFLGILGEGKGSD
jgi:hypothetical protein